MMCLLLASVVFSFGPRVQRRFDFSPLPPPQIVAPTVIQEPVIMWEQPVQDMTWQRQYVPQYRMQCGRNGCRLVPR